MPDDVRDWSAWEPEPQDVGAFARDVAATPPEGHWDDYALVADVDAIAAPVGWFVPLVEGRSTDADEAAAFAAITTASLRDELGESTDRAVVAGYRDASWFDAVAVALGAERALTWSVDGVVVALLDVAVDESRDLWLVTCAADAATVPLAQMLGDDEPATAGENPVTQALDWLTRFRIDIGVEAGGTLDGWFPDDVPAEELARLTPIARVDGSGGLAATWTSDAGETLVVLLGSEGESHVLADSPLDFVRLLGVGYEEVGRAGGAVDGAFGPLLAALVRAWVTETFGVEVPREWVAGAPDEFSEWVGGLLGEEPTTAAPTGGIAPELVTGDIAAYVDALGRPDGLAVIAAVLGLPPTTTVAKLERQGVNVNTSRRGPTMVLVDLIDYPRADEVLGDIPSSTDLDGMVVRWGDPESRAPDGRWARWVVGERWVHLTFDDEGVFQVTAMLDAP